MFSRFIPIVARVRIRSSLLPLQFAFWWPHEDHCVCASCSDHTLFLSSCFQSLPSRKWTSSQWMEGPYHAWDWGKPQRKMDLSGQQWPCSRASQESLWGVLETLVWLRRFFFRWLHMTSGCEAGRASLFVSLGTGWAFNSNQQLSKHRGLLVRDQRWAFGQFSSGNEIHPFGHEMSIGWAPVTCQAWSSALTSPSLSVSDGGSGASFHLLQTECISLDLTMILRYV